MAGLCFATRTFGLTLAILWAGGGLPAVLSQHSPGTAVAQVVAEKSARLSPVEIEQRVQALPDWTTDGEALYYTRTFENFVEAIAFVNRLVQPAEAAGHHPDITINYNKVALSLTTHDAGGLTEKDFQLAQTISQLENSP